MTKKLRDASDAYEAKRLDLENSCKSFYPSGENGPSFLELLKKVTVLFHSLVVSSSAFLPLIFWWNLNFQNGSIYSI